MNCIKKHIIRKKLHLSRQQFRDLEYRINLIKKIVKPIAIAFITKALVLGLKELASPKIDLDFIHHPQNKKHFNKHKKYFKHHQINTNKLIDFIYKSIESITPLIASGFGEYKNSYPNSFIVNILEELVKKEG